MTFVQCMRPKQFIKNFLIFTPAIFQRNAAHSLLNPHVFLTLLLTFAFFSAMVGCTYIINDYVDLERDRHNPSKRGRPMAAGRISPKLALRIALIAIPLLLVVQFLFFKWEVGAAFLLYLVTTLTYSFVLKNIVIIDIMTIAALFILRSYIGCLAIDVPLSLAFMSCIGSVALFIATSKRHHEYKLTTSAVVGVENARLVIREYNNELLLMLLSVSAVGALITYTLFALNEAPAGFGLSIPLVFYGLFRFLYLAVVRGVGGTPEITLIRDRPLIITVGLWLTLLLALYYRSGHSQ